MKLVLHVKESIWWFNGKLRCIVVLNILWQLGPTDSNLTRHEFMSWNQFGNLQIYLLYCAFYGSLVLMLQIDPVLFQFSLTQHSRFSALTVQLWSTNNNKQQFDSAEVGKSLLSIYITWGKQIVRVSLNLTVRDSYVAVGAALLWWRDN